MEEMSATNGPTPTEDPITSNLRSQLAMLAGQSQVQRLAIAALVAASPERAQATELMAIMWSDLRIQLQPAQPPFQTQPERDRHSRWNGANTEWNQLQSAIAEHRQS